MIHADEIKKYQDECPKKEDSEWEITRHKLENIASYPMPSDWLARMLVNIERDIIERARDYREKINGIYFTPYLALPTLHCGLQFVYLKKEELEILDSELKKYGYTLVLGKEWAGGRYSNCKIEWK